mgnify:CR=1 FL=1
MFDKLALFTAWPILTGLLVGYIANRIMSGEGKGCHHRVRTTHVIINEGEEK